MILVQPPPVAKARVPAARNGRALGVYGRCILPRLIDLAMRRRPFAELREQLVAGAHGRVLEIGVGSGLNLPFYPRDLELLLGLDPSPELLAMARRHASWTHFPVELAEGRAEAIPLDDRSVDQVVMSWTLCSVADPARALAEIQRVLRPGGSLLFIEHGQSPELQVRRWQDRLTPLWRRVAGGCHLDRPIDRLIAAAGLRITDLDTGYLIKGPRFATYHYRGRAVLG